MNAISEIVSPTELELVVAFFDLARFAPIMQRLSPLDCYALMDAYYDFVGQVVEEDGGLVIKFIGDSGLIVYPVEQASQAVHHLLALREQGDAWLRQRGLDSWHVIQAHVGPVICGRVGTRREKRLDVFGETVIIAAKLQTQGFAITPQLFRKLDAETRTLFKKHTPPITYIPFDASHRSH